MVSRCCKVRIALRADGSEMIDDDSGLPVFAASVREGDKDVAVELIRRLSESKTMNMNTNGAV